MAESAGGLGYIIRRIVGWTLATLFTAFIAPIVVAMATSKVAPDSPVGRFYRWMYPGPLEHLVVQPAPTITATPPQTPAPSAMPIQAPMPTLDLVKMNTLAADDNIQMSTSRSVTIDQGNQRNISLTVHVESMNKATRVYASNANSPLDGWSVSFTSGTRCSIDTQTVGVHLYRPDQVGPSLKDMQIVSTTGGVTATIKAYCDHVVNSGDILVLNAKVLSIDLGATAQSFYPTTYNFSSGPLPVR